MVQLAKGVVMAMGCALALAGCGSGGGSGAEGDKAKPDAVDGTQPPPNWKATDACSILDKAAVAEILKREVSETHLALVTEPGAATAGGSECTYAGSDGNVASLMTRWSPIKDNTPESIAAARAAGEAAMKAFGKVPEDVPGLGKAAFYTPGIDQLTVFIDEARMIVVTAQKVPDRVSGKDVTIALAKKAGA